MVIDEQFYFVALKAIDSGVGHHLLVGVDFHGGLSSATLSRLNDCNFVVDNSGLRRLIGKLDSIHQQGHGYRFVLRDQESLTFPCVLTTNPRVRWLYSGEVGVVANDKTFGFEEVTETGIPLSGENWLGLLRRRDDRLHLDAYSTGNVRLGRKMNAFCPDWTEGFHQQGALIFSIEMRNTRSLPSDAAYQ